VNGPRVVLVLGGARSGKSSFAERIVAESGLTRVYVATAEALDEEMAARIAHHQRGRGKGWRTVEAPLALAETLAAEAAPDRVVLVDCLTLWLTNLILAGAEVEPAVAALEEALALPAGPMVLVSNEVGHGIVPETPLGRAFRDAQGRLNQTVARVASDVVLVAAGCALRLKPAAPVEIAW
jgi:adenosylcobinamide kinase/adenosylcobinamide-phosphate guanylyltransferase